MKLKSLFAVLFMVCVTMLLASCGETECENHNMSEWYTLRAATCSAEGRLRRECTACGEIEYENLSKTEHTPGAWRVVEEATCISEGEKERICSVCEAVLETKSIDKLAHESGEWTVKTKETCTEAGEKVKKCIHCDTQTESEEIAPHHTEAVISAVKATCTSVGYTEGKGCSACGDVLTAPAEIPKTEHNFQPVAAVKATCSAYGYTEGLGCTECGNWQIEPTRIDKLPHTEEADEAVEETCTENGLTAGVHCSVCKAVIVAQEKIDKLGHDWGGVYSNSCSRCSEKQYTELSSRNEWLEYDWSDDAIVYLDKCVTVSNTSEYWTLTIGSDMKYLRLVGTAGVEYNVRIVISSDITDTVRIDLVNASIKTLTNAPIVESSGSAAVEIGFYGEKSAIIGRDGGDGRDGPYGSKITYDGENGANGNMGVSVKGALKIIVAADHASISGGDGGDGGDGYNGFPIVGNGYKGGNGGNGAYAVSADSITVVGEDGKASSSLILTGGTGGSGGSASKNDTDGTAGTTMPATNITAEYK